MPGIDMHAHTTASDGSLTPTELVTLASQIGLDALAVTDHDTVDGIAEAVEAAQHIGLELIPGIELAVEYTSGRFHMLGYDIDPSSKTLSDRLTLLKHNRLQRNVRIVEKLQSLGFDISMADVERESRGGQIGRPHLAAALVRKKLASSSAEAFETYLKDGALAHVPKDKISLQEGIDLIHSAGGKAVMAHPSSVKLDDSVLQSELFQFAEMGLDGMECCYNLYSPERCDEYAAMAANAGLLTTGGSDFHGDAKPKVFLGHVIGTDPAPYALLENLRQNK